MSLKKSALVVFACVIGMAAPVGAQQQLYTGDGADDLWSNPANWNGNAVPTAADVARFPTDGSTTLINSTVTAVASAFELGHPGASDPLPNSASSVINMTGGSLTALALPSNIGRGVTTDPDHLVEFNMFGGTLDVRGISIPEGFNTCDTSPIGNECVPMNTNFNVSGNSVVNTDFLRLGTGTAVTNMVVSDNATVNVLARGLNGFTNGSI